MLFFSVKYNHIRKILSEKINTKIYNQSRMYNICPVSATIRKFDSSEFMNINFRGDIVAAIGQYKSRRRIDDKKKALDSVFEAHTTTRPSTIFKKHLEAIDGDSFGAGNLTGTGVTLNSIHVAASRVCGKYDNMERAHDNVLKLQKQFEEDDKNEKSLIKKNFPVCLLSVCLKFRYSNFLNRRSSS